jgi:hypothetical protein
MVESDSVSSHVYRDWNRAYNGCIGKFIGPKYAVRLSPEELESDARCEARKEVLRDREREERRRRDMTVLEKLEARLAVAPEMSFIAGGKTRWDEWLAAQNEEKFGVDIFEYARQWARLMEFEITHWKMLEDVEKETFREVSEAGDITGFMSGAMISVLEKCWKYGKQLCCWVEEKEARDKDIEPPFPVYTERIPGGFLIGI